MRRASFLLALALSGCGVTPIALRYRPSSAPAPFAAKPKVFIAEVADQTTQATSDVNLQMRLTLKATLQTPYGQALRDGLKAELTRLGVPVVAAAAADASLEPTLTAVLFSANEGGIVYVPMSAAFKYRFALKDKAGAPLCDAEIVGKGSSHEFAPGLASVGGGPNEAVNAAFADALAQLGSRLASCPLFK